MNWLTIGHDPGCDIYIFRKGWYHWIVNSDWDTHLDLWEWAGFKEAADFDENSHGRIDHHKKMISIASVKLDEVAVRMLMYWFPNYKIYFFRFGTEHKIERIS